jgi:hypothetical protein
MIIEISLSCHIYVRPDFMTKPNAYHMCAQKQYFHTYRQYKCLQYAKYHKYSIIIT